LTTFLATGSPIMDLSFELRFALTTFLATRNP